MRVLFSKMHFGAFFIEGRQPLDQTILARRTLLAAVLAGNPPPLRRRPAGVAAPPARRFAGCARRRRFLLEVGESLTIGAPGQIRASLSGHAPPRPPPAACAGIGWRGVIRASAEIERPFAQFREGLAGAIPYLLDRSEVADRERCRRTASSCG